MDSTEVAIALPLFAVATVYFYRKGYTIDRARGTKKGLLVDVTALVSMAVLATMIASSRPARQILRSAPEDGMPAIAEANPQEWRYIVAIVLVGLLIWIGLHYARKGVSLVKILLFGGVAVAAGIAFPQTTVVIDTIITAVMAVATFLWNWYVTVFELWS